MHICYLYLFCKNLLPLSHPFPQNKGKRYEQNWNPTHSTIPAKYWIHQALLGLIVSQQKIMLQISIFSIFFPLWNFFSPDPKPLIKV